MSPHSNRSRSVVVGALGIFEILSWGSTFYLLSVLAAPIAAETGWPLAGVVGGLSAGLLVAGLVSPRIGEAVDRRGGRPVLAFSALVTASGLVVLALAPALPTFLGGWLLLGLGMGTGLYDPAFATLGRLYGSEARPAITALTLWGGFASTVSWPLSAFLVEQAGWRGTCLAYAGLQLCVALPLVLALVPNPAPHPLRKGEPSAPVPTALGGRERRAFLLMAGVLTLGGTVMTLASVHLVTLLQARGVPLASAVTYGALIGPSQVAARILEMAGRGRYHPLWTLTAAMSLIALGILLLANGLPAVALALVLYGAGNGIYSIARGTVPLALFGPERYARLIGRLARPGLVAQALAPLVGAFVVTEGGADALFAILAALALANVGLVGALWRVR
ncbi:MFS family permease [Methylobacterium sp. BE186]|uniref:MFS transporter n=1 Tax=Methylobacterium sp. BE186 TaxID=2817715 RepID=UPI0028609421|nr:MFS transporter [Methylobacterium sp. BE186]MDR7039903.1 MFS family permease [Methylobacterium sp. BE186]